MRKGRFPLLVLALLLTVLAMIPAAPASAYQCLCEIICWQQGDQVCWQDSCCRVTCCDPLAPGCYNPCW
jgi:hypothetical protein